MDLCNKILGLLDFGLTYQKVIIIPANQLSLDNIRYIKQTFIMQSFITILLVFSLFFYSNIFR